MIRYKVEKNAQWKKKIIKKMLVWHFRTTLQDHKRDRL